MYARLNVYPNLCTICCTTYFLYLNIYSSFVSSCLITHTDKYCLYIWWIWYIGVINNAHYFHYFIHLNSCIVYFGYDYIPLNHPRILHKAQLLEMQINLSLSSCIHQFDLFWFEGGGGGGYNGNHACIWSAILKLTRSFLVIVYKMHWYEIYVFVDKSKIWKIMCLIFLSHSNAF